MQFPVLSQTAFGPPPTRLRLYYLDWLRVLLTAGVFLAHVSDVFNDVNFEIKNAEQSSALTFFQGFVFPWGMPLFFLLAGAGSYYALRKRTPGEFTRERTLRILIPFLTGTLLLGPLQIYLSWRHRVETGVIEWTLGQFVAERFARIGPKWFGAIGYHMWFLGYLFAFALLALPLFTWFKGPNGQRWVTRLAEFCHHRGGILLFILPLVVVRLLLQPFFPVQHDWADFCSYGAFYILGYLIFLDERFFKAIRRDWWILLIVCLVATLWFGILVVSIPGLDLERAPGGFPEFLLWALVSAAGWCGTAFMMFIGMRWLDRTGRVQRYCLEIMLPFFVIHQPIILAIAYFVVQWNMGLLPKTLVVLVSSFGLSLGACELLIKRVGVLRRLFGIKPARAEVTQPALAV
jgi:glucan biosynthesis protein C